MVVWWKSVNLETPCRIETGRVLLLCSVPGAPFHGDAGVNWLQLGFQESLRLAKSPASMSPLMPLLASLREGKAPMSERGVPSREAKSDADGIGHGANNLEETCTISRSGICVMRLRIK